MKAIKDLAKKRKPMNINDIVYVLSREVCDKIYAGENFRNQDTGNEEHNNTEKPPNNFPKARFINKEK